jgi:hypothetical protein
MTYQQPALGTLDAQLTPADKPTVIVKMFKFDSIRQEAYWVTQYVKQFKTIEQANNYINQVMEQNK